MLMLASREASAFTVAAGKGVLHAHRSAVLSMEMELRLLEHLKHSD